MVKIHLYLFILVCDFHVTYKSKNQEEEQLQLHSYAVRRCKDVTVNDCPPSCLFSYTLYAKCHPI
jgi:hypothetical protein